MLKLLPYTMGFHDFLHSHNMERSIRVAKVYIECVVF